MYRRTPWRAIAVVVLLLASLTLASAPATAAEPPSIVQFWLVDADTDTRLVQLDDYDSLRLPMLPPRLSVEVVATDDAESVRMEIDHVQSSLENHAPYALRGDQSGDFNPAPELRVAGWITVSAQPYAGADLTGDAGPEVKRSLYLHQPDFVVRSSLDKGDYDPGDGWCTIGHPRRLADHLAVAATSQLSETEAVLRDLDRPSEKQDVVSARADGLVATIEVDDVRSSKRLRLAAEAANKEALAQIDLRGAAPAIEVDPEPEREKIVFDQAEADRGEPRLDRPKAGPAISDGIAHDLSIDDRLAPDFYDLDIDIGDLVPWFNSQSCTLRAAIEESNALAGRQSIVIDSSKGPFALSLGQIDITDGVDVIGYGQRAVVDAERRSRVFSVAGDHIVNLRSLELTNGNPGSTARGGALRIDDEAHVQMSDSVVRDSQANFGGGIYLGGGGRLSLSSSAVRDNTAGTPGDGISGGGVTQRGGGIFNLGGVVRIRDSAVFDNIAVRGGGLSNFGGTMRVENSSVIDNEALALGGGIENHDRSEGAGVLHLSFATVANNQAGTSGAPPASHRVGGGLYNSGTAFLASSIMAGNTDGHSAGDPLHAPDCRSTERYGFSSYRNNVVGVLNGNCDLRDYNWGTTAWIDHGTEAAPLDARLTGKLFWDHRHYRMIMSNSPAIDGGASPSASLYPCPDTDSRGRMRPVGGGCDIGSVERQ